MIAVGLYVGSRNVAGFRCWLNPLRSGDPEVAGRAADAVFEVVHSRGAQEIATIDAVLPFEVCSDCDELSFRAPNEWLKPTPAKAAKFGRNDPCPCGSGLKYKRCCGAM
jgi:hypothetical protein